MTASPPIDSVIAMSGWGGKLKVVIAVLAIIGLLLPTLAQAVTLNELLNQQNKIRADQEAKEKLLKQNEAEQASLENAIGNIEGSIGQTMGRISYTEGQINLTSEVIAKLNEEISLQQKQSDDLNARLRVAYGALYELSRVSSTVRLAQGDTVSDIVSQGMYVQAIQDQLQRDIQNASNILADLDSKKAESEKQKKDLDDLRSRLAADKSHLDRQKTQKERFLLASEQDEAKLQEDLRKLEKQQETLSAEIYEARRRMGSGETTTGGTGGYPYTGSCGGVDPWMFYKCQCTSYAAWAFLRETGLVFYNTRPGQGNAWNWPALAADQGYTVSSTPRVGDIVSWPQRFPNMPYGHVAMVRGVRGGLIDVEEYNWVSPERYSYRKNVNPATYGTPRYIRP